ncbi:NUDIX domain-containing protein [Ramlibacter sp. AW1]|uniref:NUDIX domain-containing protein n=1 Tax=Ramlibacter aurantiacus TaxID=2801330 RepID=A0A936ZST4_9BURK|nr:NUDIX domain-containing protein [Ramlibacter aurantiacus]MBL0419969.1 NUDIX domain-containing protein [Ramlibacter aurantiacus]
MERVAACIGPFQLPSHADFARLRQALAGAARLHVFLTGAHRPHSPRHPFTWTERAGLLRDGLAPDEQARVSFHPLREGVGLARIHAELQQAVPEGAVALAFVEGVREFEPPPGWHLAAPAAPDQDRLREQLVSGADLAPLQSQLPAHVWEFISRWVAGPHYAQVREEYEQLASEKVAWSVAPYPVVLVTVDAVVRVADQVLLIRRGRQPGKGLRALPGGFLDPGETVLASALRELAEETGLQTPELRRALRGVRVFDDPERSQRGRVITHAHYFDLGPRPLPGVSGEDDAAAAEWVPIATLPTLEAEFLDDHFLILDHFLHVMPAAAAAGA